MTKSLLQSSEPIREYRRLLGFEQREGWPGILRSQPMVPFKPMGLLLFNVPPGTLLGAAVIAQREQVCMSAEFIPAQFFESGENFQQVSKKIQEGYDYANWIDWQPVTPGQVIQLSFTHSRKVKLDEIQAVMWGRAQQP